MDIPTRMPEFRFSALITGIALVIAAAPSPISAAPTAATKHVTARLVTDAQSVEPGGTLALALHKRIAPRWHTYWQNPGDSGLATTIAWSLPSGATAGEIQWPHPQRIAVGPVMNYGYENEVTLLSTIRVPESARAGDAFPIRATVDWLVCEEICIPEQVELSLSLPVVGKGLSAGISQPVIEAARAKLPRELPWSASVNVADGKILLALDSATSLQNAWFFSSEWGAIEHAAPQPAVLGNGKFTLALKPSQTKLPETLRGVLVVTENGAQRSYLIETPIVGALAATAPLAAFQMPEIGFGMALLFALLGGIILNLMPCVFPVLSIKVLSLLNHSRANKRHRHRQGLAYTAGVLACFAVFAAIVLAVKAGGAQLGWGFQFQSPLFVLLLAYLMFAVGLSQSGLFAVGNSFSRLGAFGGNDGLAMSFLAGALAAVVATPCTAPFMGAALGFAVAQPAPILIAVFLALGLGLALPYLALCYWPLLLRFLPKPGAWMERFKQALAFPMYAVAVWLVWVLAQQSGPNAVAAALGGMVLIAFGAWLVTSTKQSRPVYRRVAASVAAFFILIATAIGFGAIEQGSATPQVTATNSRHEVYTPARFGQLRSEGRPVFVNLTAAWCITCLVNERIALDRTDVIDAFKAANVAYLKGDWTHRDPDITAKLAKFGRNGVPLYVFYPAGANSAPVVLPQILTTEIVLREISKTKTANIQNNQNTEE